MSRGRRYNDEPKLNIKKVIAVIVLILVIIMFIFAIQKILKNDTDKKIKTTSYFTVYTNEKWGIIDSEGKIIIPAEYDEMIIIPNKTEAVFLCTYDVNYEDNTYKTKVLNAKNKEIFTEFEKVEPIYNYDKNNNLWYEANVLKVQKNGKYGLVNFNGKQILDCNYDEIESLKDTENSIIIKQGENVGLVDTTGNIIIPTEYKEITAIENNYQYGYIVKNNEDKYGVIDTNKKIILEAKYEEIKSIYSPNKYVVKIDGNYQIIDKDQNVVLDKKYDDITEINGENVIVVENNKYGIVNTSGEEKIEPSYEEIKCAFDNYYIAKKDGKYGLINLENETLIDFENTSITYRKEADMIEVEQENEIETKIYDNEINLKLTGIISEINETKGYIKIRIGDEYKYYNFKFEEKNNTELLTNNEIFLSKNNGKYGFVDKNRKVVVDYIYDDATELNNYNFAAVKQNGLWGCINEKGKVIVEPKYDLENNIKIDFIGKYHISEDLNAAYYTDM